jgi:hypothetical protein
LQAPARGHHGRRRLQIHPQRAGVNGDGEGLRGGQWPGEVAVDQQAPDVGEAGRPDQGLDVHPAVAQGAAAAVGFGDPGVERDDVGQSRFHGQHHSNLGATNPHVNIDPVNMRR